MALEVVVLLGTVAGDQAAAQLIVNTGILHALVNLLNGMCESVDLLIVPMVPLSKGSEVTWLLDVWQSIISSHTS